MKAFNKNPKETKEDYIKRFILFLENIKYSGEILKYGFDEIFYYSK